MAKPLRPYFSHVWSNARPNSDSCPKLFEFACHIIKKLVEVNFYFNIVVLTKDIVRSLRNTDATISVVSHNPGFPWDIIWPLSFNSSLDNKLKDFQWRLAHRVLYTGSRIADWGMGDGICPMLGCTCIESIEHLFWDCPKIQPIISWLKRVFKILVGDDSHFTVTYFLMGFPHVKLSKTLFNRLWFVLCVSKFIIWKSRCIHVFQYIVHPSDVILSLIVKQIKNRIRTDRWRFTKTKFYQVWISNRSFVSLRGERLDFKFI